MAIAKLFALESNAKTSYVINSFHSIMTFAKISTSKEIFNR